MIEVGDDVTGRRIDVHVEISENGELIGSIADVAICNILDAMSAGELIALQKRIETRLNAGMYR